MHSAFIVSISKNGANARRCFWYETDEMCSFDRRTYWATSCKTRAVRDDKVNSTVEPGYKSSVPIPVLIIQSSMNPDIRAIILIPVHALVFGFDCIKRFESS